MIWRLMKWTMMAAGAYYVWQNVVKPELENRTGTPSPSMSMRSTPTTIGESTPAA